MHKSTHDPHHEESWTKDILLRHELPMWFIKLADSRSKGKLSFIVFDRSQVEDVIYADYVYDDDFLETKCFQIKLKK